MQTQPPLTQSLPEPQPNQSQFHQSPQPSQSIIPVASASGQMQTWRGNVRGGFRGQQRPPRGPVNPYRGPEPGF